MTWPRAFGGVLVCALRVHCGRSVHCVTLFWLSDALCMPWRQVQCKAEALAPHKAGLVDGVDEVAAMGGASVAVVRTVLQSAVKWRLCLSDRSSAA